MKIKSLAIFSALLLAAACATNNNMSSSSGSMGTMGSGMGNGMMLSDADIAAIVTNANQGEIDQANAALGKASSADVRAFAQMMVTDHTNALNQARDLFSRRNITANTSNSVASDLQSNSQQTVSALSTYSGSSFDQQYINSQVQVHQWLLNSLDNTLIPAAHNRQLRDFLQTQRAAVSSHLDRARQIQNSVGRP